MGHSFLSPNDVGPRASVVFLLQEISSHQISCCENTYGIDAQQTSELD